MNREIKFKAKRKDNGEWVYGYLVKQNENEIYICEDVDSACLIIPETICEYTGLNDKNGVEIYENDICIGNSYSLKERFIIKFGKYKTDEWKEKFSAVKTCQYGWYAEYISSKSQVHLVSPNGIEVIGNKFDEEVKENE